MSRRMVTLASVARGSVVAVAGLWFVALGIVSAAPVQTAGSAGVDRAGSVTHSIPIAIPPGTFGMQPRLALGYRSQSGGAQLGDAQPLGDLIKRQTANGLVGVGWSLEGLSSIQRCPGTVVNDGAVGGIRYDTSDRYCLDGMRLVVHGYGVYGMDGTDGIPPILRTVCLGALG